MLDRLEAATERRDPVIADLARQLRNRYFDQPVIAAAPGARPTRRSSAHLDALVEDPERADRAEHVDAVVDCPQLLAPLLIAPHAGDDRARAPGAAGDHDPALLPRARARARSGAA